MLRRSSWIVALISFLLPLTVFQAQEKQPETRPAPPQVTSLIPDKEDTVVGWLDVIPFTSKIFHNTRMLRVWVPGNYLSPHNAHRRYPVLYMQDGQNLFDKTTASAGEWQMDETADHLIGSFKIGQMFIVGIDNAGEKRSTEYLPYPDPRNPQFPSANDVRGKDYGKFLLTEVMPFLVKKYRIATGAPNTGIGGSSYGAVVSLYTALDHPTVFGHVLIESPPLWVGDGELLKDAQKAKLLPQKIYIGVGSAESEDIKHAEEEVQDVKDLEKVLRAKGMGSTRLKVVVQEGARHNEAAWSSRLPEAMLFLYGKNAN